VGKFRKKGKQKSVLLLFRINVAKEGEIGWFDG
jgi:hypothetical protein